MRQEEPQSSGDAGTRKSRRFRVPVWVRVTVSALLLWYVLQQVDLRGALSLLGRADPGALLAVVATMVASKVFTAYRWYVLVKCWEPDARLWPLVRITFVSNFFGMFLPGGTTEVIRVAALKQAGSSFSISFSSVVLDRVLGLASLVVILLIGGILFEGLSVPAATLYIGIALVCFAVCIVVMAHPATHAFLVRLTRDGSRLRTGLTTFIELLVTFRKQPKAVLWSFALAFGMQIFRVMWFYFGALALDASVSLVWLLILVPIFVFMTALPISFGGVGVKEAILLQFFAGLGFSSQVAVAFALLLYLTNFIACLPGLWSGVQLLAGRKHSIRRAGNGGAVNL